MLSHVHTYFILYRFLSLRLNIFANKMVLKVHKCFQKLKSHNNHIIFIFFVNIIFVPVNFSLHYAIVTVGTPALTFLVALDTGSDLFWLPCDCTSCSRSLNSTSGKVC